MIGKHLIQYGMMGYLKMLSKRIAINEKNHNHIGRTFVSNIIKSAIKIKSGTSSHFCYVAVF